MIQADAPMCEEWGWKKGRDGKEEPSECSHMPVGCCKSGFYVGDHCGCLVRCFGQTETLSSRLLFFCQYYCLRSRPVTPNVVRQSVSQLVSQLVSLQIQK